jgi:DNA repair protein RadA/Sms
MMAKARTAYVCTDCGAEHNKWQGQCAECGQWNTLSAFVVQPASATAAGATPGGARNASYAGEAAGSPQVTPLTAVAASAGESRTLTGIGEFDRVLGGGLVDGSIVLIGGDPGIGKSTLLLQVAARLASAGKPVVYVSGEESAEQVRLRAIRLGLGAAPVRLAAATSVRDILTTMSAGAPPALLIVDSIQTMHSDLIEGAPGTVSQVRASAQELVRFAKEQGTAVVLVGHVTKDGTIAGPRSAGTTAGWR